MPPKQKSYEPGSWVSNMPAGIQQPNPPEIIRDAKLSSHEIREIAAYEGLGFCLHSYISSQRITDNHLRLLWIKAHNAMQDVIDFLEDLPPEKKPHKKKTVRYNKRVTKANTEAVNFGREL